MAIYNLLFCFSSQVSIASYEDTGWGQAECFLCCHHVTLMSHNSLRQRQRQHWLIRFVPMPWKSDINTTYTNPVCLFDWFLATYWRQYFHFMLSRVSVICSNYHLPSRNSPGCCMAELCKVSISLMLSLRVCYSAVSAWHPARTSIFLLSISGSLHAPTIIHPGRAPGARTHTAAALPSCVRHKPTFVL